ncbi:enoyl-CoA hydratase-related protein [Segnochrobactraceae bacterium EtOH-i3]
MGFDYHKDSHGIVTVTMDMDGQSANTMSPVYHSLMGECVARLEGEPGLTGIIFASAKKTFFAGGDLNGLLARDTADAAYFDWLEEDKGFLRRLERLPVPVVAAINGAALGGGFEICLACNHRVLVAAPGVVVGLPEVTLGLLPGAGGIVRLTALLGLDAALPLLLEGRILAPEAALAAGVVDALLPAGSDPVAVARDWIRANPDAGRQPWDRPGFRPPAADGFDPDACVAAARAALHQRTRGRAPAPERILDVALLALKFPVDAALTAESRAFCTLVGSREAKAAIATFFFSANAIRSGKLRPAGPGRRLARLAVLDPGPDETELAIRAARAGIPTVIVAGDGDEKVARILASARESTRSRLAVTLSAAPRLDGVTADLVLAPRPAAPGDVRDILARLPEGSVLALPPGSPASAPPASERVIGLVRSGAPGAMLAEIIAGPVTAPDAVALAYDLALRTGLTPVVVHGAGGFVARLIRALRAEAAMLLEDGLSPAAVNMAAWQAGFTGPPLLDGDTDARVPPGWQRGRVVEGAEIEDRLLLAGALEALRCLAEGVIGSEAEADLGSILGAGFPRHTGGALRFLRGLGLADVRARAATLADHCGPRFRPDPALWERLDAAEPRAA